MDPSRKTALVAACTVFFAVVGIQVAWPFIPRLVNLKGVVAVPPPVDWSWAAFKSGRTSREIETWYNTRVGLRDLWVALDSQVSYTFFGETVPRPEGTSLVVGIHDWFFERHYVQTAVTPGGTDASKLKAKAAQLKSVQAKLAKRGIPLYVIVAPSKAEIYPEHIPPAYLAGRQMAEIRTDFENMRPLYREEGIDYYDGPEQYAARKASGERNLFARSGTHWSYASAVRVLQDMREHLNPRLKHPIPELDVESSPVGPPRANDLDLIELANLITPWPYAHDIPYPVMVPQAATPTKDLPRILWVHDSFGWILIELLYNAKAMQPSESLYYFKTPKIIPGAENIPDRDIANIDWENYLKSFDAVVVVWTEIAGDFGFNAWGFIETLDKALK